VKKRAWLTIVGLSIVLVVLALTSVVPAAAAGGPGIPSGEEIVVGPINVVPVIEVTTKAFSQAADLSALEPGDTIATVVWEVKNLSKRSRYVSQGYWTENADSNNVLAVLVDYTQTGGQTLPDYYNVFGIPAGATMTLTAKFIVGDYSRAVTGSKLHIQKPALSTLAIAARG